MTDTLEPTNDTLRFCWHLRGAGIEDFLSTMMSAFPPVIGSVVTLHLSSGREEYWVIAECPVRGIEDGREHHLVTLSPKGVQPKVSNP
jgi:hypothetical protein